MVKGHQALGAHIQFVKTLGGTAELHVLIVLSHEGLHHANGLHILLHTLVQFVVLDKHLREQAGHPRDDVVEREAKNEHGHDENERQAGGRQ